MKRVWLLLFMMFLSASCSDSGVDIPPTASIAYENHEVGYQVSVTGPLADAILKRLSEPPDDAVPDSAESMDTLHYLTIGDHRFQVWSGGRHKLVLMDGWGVRTWDMSGVQSDLDAFLRREMRGGRARPVPGGPFGPMKEDDCKLNGSIGVLVDKVGRRDNALPGSPIVGLDLHCRDITDADLEQIKKLRLLRELDISHTQVTDAGLKNLRGMPALQSLTVGGGEITDAGMEHLRALRNLRTLHLYCGEGVTDAGLADVGGLQGLNELHISRATRITDAGLKILGELRSLQVLDVKHSEITDTALQALAETKSLRTLSLTFARVSDSGLRGLSGLPHLRVLRLSHAVIANEGLKGLRATKSLRELDLSHSNVGDEGLRYLRELKTLEKLDLSYTRITSAGLGGLDRLRMLDLQGSGITDEDLKGLSLLEGLEGLSLSGTKISDAGLAELVGLKNLKSLVVVRTGVTKEGVTRLRERLPKVKILHSLPDRQGYGQRRQLGQRMPLRRPTAQRGEIHPLPGGSCRLCAMSEEGWATQRAETPTPEREEAETWVVSPCFISLSSPIRDTQVFEEKS